MGRTGSALVSRTGGLAVATGGGGAVIRAAPDLFAAAGLAPETGPEPPAVVVLRQVEVEIFSGRDDDQEQSRGLPRHFAALAAWAHLKRGLRYMELPRKTYYRKTLDDWKAKQFTE